MSPFCSRIIGVELNREKTMNRAEKELLKKRCGELTLRRHNLSPIHLKLSLQYTRLWSSSCAKSPLLVLATLLNTTAWSACFSLGCLPTSSLAAQKERMLWRSNWFGNMSCLLP